VGAGEPEVVCFGDADREGFGFGFGFRVELLACVPGAGRAGKAADLCRAGPCSAALREDAAAAGEFAGSAGVVAETRSPPGELAAPEGWVKYRSPAAPAASGMSAAAPMVSRLRPLAEGPGCRPERTESLRAVREPSPLL
jgi:hypothetical protein